MKQLLKTCGWLTLFAIAMGFLETSVVVYLRKLYYPNGFSFPLAPIEPSIAIVESWREAATVIMLLGAGILTGKDKLSRFAWFIYAFAIWDIFYYIFLKLLLNWPESLFTWDILFLIPVPWVGPVIAPCIVSLTMILLALLIVYYQSKNYRVVLTKAHALLLLGGALVCVYGFCYDYIQYATAGSGVWTINSDTHLFEDIKTYVPKVFNWFLFWSGELLMLAGIGGFWARTRLSIFHRSIAHEKI